MRMINAKPPMAMARKVPSAEAKTDLKKSFMGGGKERVSLK
jgi:hypothetical protein